MSDGRESVLGRNCPEWGKEYPSNFRTSSNNYWLADKTVLSGEPDDRTVRRGGTFFSGVPPLARFTSGILSP
jgi:hypothetical protein